MGETGRLVVAGEGGGCVGEARDARATADIPRETIEVKIHDDLLHITHNQVRGDGVDLGGSLWLQRGNAAWLAEQIEKGCVVWGVESLDAVRGGDPFTVYVGGSDMQPFVHARNQRLSTTPTLVGALGMTVPVAELLLQRLRRLGA